MFGGDVIQGYRISMGLETYVCKTRSQAELMDHKLELSHGNLERSCLKNSKNERARNVAVWYSTPWFNLQYDQNQNYKISASEKEHLIC